MDLWQKGNSIVLHCHICTFASSPKAGKFNRNTTHSP